MCIRDRFKQVRLGYIGLYLIIFGYIWLHDGLSAALPAVPVFYSSMMKAVLLLPMFPDFTSQTGHTASSPSPADPRQAIFLQDTKDCPHANLGQEEFLLLCTFQNPLPPNGLSFLCTLV